MTEDVIERYDTLNTKVCTDKLFFGNFNDKLILSNCFNMSRK